MKDNARSQSLISFHLIKGMDEQATSIRVNPKSTTKQVNSAWHSRHKEKLIEETSRQEASTVRKGDRKYAMRAHLGPEQREICRAIVERALGLARKKMVKP